MARNHGDWLQAFIDYAAVGEAPTYMYFWVGVSTIAGALRRRVWIDQAHFRWLSNFYIVLVAPPGVVSKSTTASIGMNLLRQVPGIRFGPDVVTWPALVQSLAKSAEAYEDRGTFYTMSAMTIESSELGNFFNPQDREMVDMLVNLWDGKEGALQKVTKTQGSDTIKNPWVNMIGCTTPSWIAGTFPDYMIGGGFTSRCIFVYAADKARLVPYPSLIIEKDFKEKAQALVQDLEHISQLAGAYELTPEAYLWGIDWYEALWNGKLKHLDNEKFSTYIARKQTHLHKLAMILAAAQRDELIITKEDLEKADRVLADIEPNMPTVFANIGQTKESKQSDELLKFMKLQGEVEFKVLFRAMFHAYPTIQMFEAALYGAEKAGYVKLTRVGSTELYIKWIGG